MACGLDTQTIAIFLCLRLLSADFCGRLDNRSKARFLGFPSGYGEGDKTGVRYRMEDMFRRTNIDEGVVLRPPVDVCPSGMLWEFFL